MIARVTAVDDVWEHTRNVRMWIATAHDALTSSRGVGGFFASWLTRGSSRRANARDAADAIGKAKLAFMDLELALHRAGRTQLALTCFGVSAVNRTAMRDALAADLGAIDSLAAEIERLQKQMRSPELR